MENSPKAAPHLLITSGSDLLKKKKMELGFLGRDR